jgi:DNA-binding SARP family transcriptional activator
MSRLAITLLGSYRVTLDGLPLTTFATDKVRALLAYLAVESGRPLRREALASLLWPDRPRTLAYTNLRQALYHLRRALNDGPTSPPHLLTTVKEVQLNPAGDHWLDVEEFEALVSACPVHHLRGLTLGLDCLSRLEAAVELYRGDFLAGFTLRACQGFAWWQLCTQEACHRQALEALHRLAVYYEAQRDHDSVARYARREIELEPWRESAYRRCMRALALTGQRGEAVRQYEICRRELAQGMGVEPSAETVQLYEQIRGDVLGGLMQASENATQPLQGSHRRWAGARQGAYPQQRAPSRRRPAG